MNSVREVRRRVYRFLYRERVEHPGTAFERSEMADFGDAKDVRAAVAYGREMGHIERVRKRYFRLTAVGMDYVERQGWGEDQHGD